jgi:hypothetical protein
MPDDGIQVVKADFPAQNTDIRVQGKDKVTSEFPP